MVFPSELDDHVVLGYRKLGRITFLDLIPVPYGRVLEGVEVGEDQSFGIGIFLYLEGVLRGQVRP
jgi:hypothetical protein